MSRAKRFKKRFDYMWIEATADNPKNKEHYIKIYETEPLAFMEKEIDIAVREERERLIEEIEQVPTTVEGVASLRGVGVNAVYINIDDFKEHIDKLKQHKKE
jgi:hypothetical protein